MTDEGAPNIKDSRMPIISWALYDWGSTAFPTSVVVSFFPVFFKTYWAGPEVLDRSTFYLGLANSIAGIILALLAPFLGVVADKGSAKKKFLAFFAFLGIIMTVALYFVSMGNWALAVFFYVLASLGYSGANLFYDSLLLTIASKKKIDFVSLFGEALGFLGGGIAFAFSVVLYLYPHWFGVTDSQTAIRISFLIVGIWWALFSIPIMLFVKEPPSSRSSVTRSLSRDWKQVRTTLGTIKQYKSVGVFLLAYWLYIDGANTVSKMAVDYGVALGFSPGSLVSAVLLVQFISFPATLLYLYVVARIGAKGAVLVTISGYGLISVLGYFIQKSWHLFALAILIALFQGSIYALSRSLYSRLIPFDKSTEFFGFYNVIGKFATIIGPLFVGLVTLLTHSNRIGISSVIVFFMAGGWLLSMVDIKEGNSI
ncbi:MAG: MFS transporter [Candidatus Margulisbacteria bacterium GWE2_39_32]|nr:MAG: MFS transporter [Candidatus Margulisbacteria bacterium GWE2_39_32]